MTTKFPLRAALFLVIPFLAVVGLESHAIYARLIIDDAKTLPGAIKTVLDQQGKADLPLDRVVDATVVDEVLRERR